MEEREGGGRRKELSGGKQGRIKTGNQKLVISLHLNFSPASNIEREARQKASSGEGKPSTGKTHWFLRFFARFMWREKTRTQNQRAQP